MNTGVRFENKRVVVSGDTFQRCEFVNCELVFDGRPTSLVGNSIIGCSWGFDGPAATTLEFLRALSADSPEFGMMVLRALGLINEKAN